MYSSKSSATENLNFQRCFIRMRGQAISVGEFVQQT